MTQLFILLALLFTIGSAFMMIRPFIGSRQDQLSFELLDEELRSIEALVARKVALVQALRDIEYDYETNKISADDYQRFKKSCERQAIGVMRRLDQIHGADKDWDAVIEQAVAERIGATDATADRPSSPEPDSPASSDDHRPDACNECHAQLKDDDRFCSQCGAPVAPAHAYQPSDNIEVAG